MRVDQGERVADEVRTLVQQPPGAPMQLIESRGANLVSIQPKLVMDTLHPINEKPSSGGSRFERFRADDITDRLISRVSQPCRDGEWSRPRLARPHTHHNKLRDQIRCRRLESAVRLLTIQVEKISLTLASNLTNETIHETSCIVLFAFIPSQFVFLFAMRRRLLKLGRSLSKRLSQLRKVVPHVLSSP